MTSNKENFRRLSLMLRYKKGIWSGKIASDVVNYEEKNRTVDKCPPREISCLLTLRAMKCNCFSVFYIAV